PGLDTITFNIPGSSVHTIQPLTALPAITDPVIIDGQTQPGFVGTPIIEIRGSSAGTGVTGITITGPNNTIKGLVINRFGGSGIAISQSQSTGNTIVGNYIGTDVTGTIDLGN